MRGRLALPALALLLLWACGSGSEEGPAGAARPPSQLAASVARQIGDPAYAESDLERGRILSLACQACHRLDSDEPHLIGPNLRGLFGREAATHADFEYSRALAQAGIVWSAETLDAWLAAPTDYVPGSSMVFAGYSGAAERRDLIAWLYLATADGEGAASP